MEIVTKGKDMFWITWWIYDNPKFVKLLLALSCLYLGWIFFLNSDHNYNRHAVGYLRWQLLLPLDFFGDGELLRAADKKFLGWIQVPAETVSHTSLINLSLELWLQWCERKVFLWNSDCSYGGVFFNILTSVMEEYQLADPGSRFKHSERFIQVRSKTSLSLQDVFLFLLPSSEQTLERKTKYATTPQSLGPQCRAPVILPSIGGHGLLLQFDTFSSLTRQIPITILILKRGPCLCLLSNPLFPKRMRTEVIVPCSC